MMLKVEPVSTYDADRLLTYYYQTAERMSIRLVVSLFDAYEPSVLLFESVSFFVNSPIMLDSYASFPIASFAA